MDIEYPKTRMDNFFAKAAGSEYADDSMEPITDREYWINEMAAKIAQGGGGGGGGAVKIELTESEDEYNLNASWNDLNGYLDGGQAPFIVVSYLDGENPVKEMMFCGAVMSEGGQYLAVFSHSFSSYNFSADTATENMVASK